MKMLKLPYHINGGRNWTNCVRTNLGDPPARTTYTSF